MFKVSIHQFLKTILFSKLSEGQRVPLEKQTPKLTEQMIRQCQVLPAKLPEGIEEQRIKAMIESGNPFFRSHNIRVNQELCRAEAQLLHPPAIAYAQNRVEPDQQGGALIYP